MKNTIQKKKRKKRKCSTLREEKCYAIFFCKKDCRIIFHGHLFCKKPGRARYCQGIFPMIYLYFLFFYFFLSGFIDWCSRSFFYYKTQGIRSDILLNPFSGGKDSGMPMRRNDATSYCCAQYREWINCHYTFPLKPGSLLTPGTWQILRTAFHSRRWTAREKTAV